MFTPNPLKGALLRSLQGPCSGRKSPLGDLGVICFKKGIAMPGSINRGLYSQRIKERCFKPSGVNHFIVFRRWQVLQTLTGPALRLFRGTCRRPKVPAAFGNGASEGLDKYQNGGPLLVKKMDSV